MNTAADAPLPGLAPDVSVHPAAAVIHKTRKWTVHRMKDVLITVYAFGLLGFGLLFPFILAAWSMIFWPPVQ